MGRTFSSVKTMKVLQVALLSSGLASIAKDHASCRREVAALESITMLAFPRLPWAPGSTFFLTGAILVRGLGGPHSPKAGSASRAEITRGSCQEAVALASIAILSVRRLPWPPGFLMFGKPHSPAVPTALVKKGFDV
jgi:hypothetical protein